MPQEWLFVGVKRETRALTSMAGARIGAEKKRSVTIVLKYGGNAMAFGDAPDPLLDDIAVRAAAGDRVVLIHGGGPQIDAALALRGLAPPRIGGLRVTDAHTLGVTESVLCGAVNKALVRALVRRGVRAAGISGQDGKTLVAHAIDAASLGFVGEVERVDPTLVLALLRAGFVPVIAPLAVAADGAHAYNVNADTAAGALAGALSADAYVVVTNVDRVRMDVRDPATGFARIDADEARALLASGAIDGGMRPKIESALYALTHGARTAIVCGSGPQALERGLRGEGTSIIAT